MRRAIIRTGHREDSHVPCTQADHEQSVAGLHPARAAIHSRAAAPRIDLGLRQAELTPDYPVLGKGIVMSYRTVAALAAVVLVGMWLATDALAQRGGRGGGGRGGANIGAGGGRGNVNVNVDRTVVRRGVGVGAAAAAGAAAGAYYYGAECGYFPYPPCY